MRTIKKVLVTGGAGYVGSALVPRLIAAGFEVTVVDLYIYGDGTLAGAKGSPLLREIKGDIRDAALMDAALEGMDAVIHLACISNDPSYDLDPELGRSINYDAFVQLVELSKKRGVGRFIYASSSSVYGIKEGVSVTEDLPLEPLTDYSRYKAECEKVLLAAAAEDFVVCVLRPATVCGYSARLRLDLTVNILTNHAVNKGEITVFGGEQLRPNIHIDDMAELYVRMLGYPDGSIHKKIFNAGYENYKVREIAEMVRKVVGDVPVRTVPTDDNRSYHVSSEKIRRELGFVPSRSIEDAVRGLRDAFAAGKVPDPLTDSRYFNIKRMTELGLK